MIGAPQILARLAAIESRIGAHGSRIGEIGARPSGDNRATQADLDAAVADIATVNADVTAISAAPVILSASDAAFPSGVVLTAGTDINISGGTISAGSGLARLSGLFDSQSFSAAGTWTKPASHTIVYLYGNNSGTLTLAGTWLASALGATVSVTTPVPGTNYRFNGVTVITPALLILSL